MPDADNENIGCLQLTRVGSRRVVQIGACIAIILSVIGRLLVFLYACRRLQHVFLHSMLQLPE
jgi:hypothetical protein